MEVLVPYDPPCAEVAALAAAFPRARFIPVAIDSARREPARAASTTTRCARSACAPRAAA